MRYYRVWVLGERNGCKSAFWDTKIVWVIMESTVNDPKDKELKESA
jgi:hypothetical protein